MKTWNKFDPTNRSTQRESQENWEEEKIQSTNATENTNKTIQL